MPPNTPREITPDMLPRLYEVGEASIGLNRLDEAAWCFERAAVFDPGSSRPLKGLAQVRQLQERPADARAAIELAIARGATAEIHTIKGQICQSQGEFDTAEAAFRSALALDPAHGHAHLRLALLRPAQDLAARIAELEHVSALASLNAEQVATLGFALGREYETQGDHERAYAAYYRANEARRAQYPGYSDTFNSADPMIAMFNSDFVRGFKGQGNPSAKPVFIVGMMRSGTTLVEQILASHRDVHGHGELNLMRVISRALAAEQGDAAAYPACLRRAPAASLAGHAASYLAHLERGAAGALRHIDKLPHNFEHLGLIAMLFPNARIIHCARDPLDACISNYFQDFGPLNPFTYDLATLGAYHRELDRLMAHWARVLPIPILRIPYEELVADQEGFSRKAVAFLGLEWDDACLRYYENTRPVFTKSLWQVRQPIFNTSVGRWKPYARHLGPLFDTLGMPPADQAVREVGRPGP